jgi:hypothetical protein
VAHLSVADAGACGWRTDMALVEDSLAQFLLRPALVKIFVNGLNVGIHLDATPGLPERRLPRDMHPHPAL